MEKWGWEDFFTEQDKEHQKLALPLRATKVRSPCRTPPQDLSLLPRRPAIEASGLPAVTILLGSPPCTTSARRALLPRSTPGAALRESQRSLIKDMPPGIKDA